MKKLLTLTLLLLATNSYGQYEFCNCRIKEGPPDFDGWSMLHAAGGAVMYGGVLRVPELFGAKEIKPINRFLYTAASAYFYEIYFDGYRNKFPLTGDFDNKGGDLKGDPVWTIFGAGLCLIGEQALKRKMYYTVQRNGLTILVEF